jgi:hypothetical protein
MKQRECQQEEESLREVGRESLFHENVERDEIGHLESLCKSDVQWSFDYRSCGQMLWGD